MVRANLPLMEKEASRYKTEMEDLKAKLKASLVKEREDNDQRQVCDPYAFKVEVRDGKIDPLSVRETIRSQGPTTPLRRPD